MRSPKKFSRTKSPLAVEDRTGGKANFSDIYLHDRAAMLSWQILANQADNVVYADNYGATAEGLVA